MRRTDNDEIKTCKQFLDTVVFVNIVSKLKILS